MITPDILFPLIAIFIVWCLVPGMIIVMALVAPYDQHRAQKMPLRIVLLCFLANPMFLIVMPVMIAGEAIVEWAKKSDRA